MLTLKALEEGSRSSEATLVHHLLLCSVKTLSILEWQLIKLPESLGKRTSLHAMSLNELCTCIHNYDVSIVL